MSQTSTCVAFVSPDDTGAVWETILRGVYRFALDGAITSAGAWPVRSGEPDGTLMLPPLLVDETANAGTR